MIDFLGIGLDLLKLLLIILLTGTAIVSIIALLHPLTFNLKLRASKLGQRAEIWASYFFGALKIGVIATPDTQDLTLKFLFWKKLLQRSQRSKPPRPASRPTPPSSGADASPGSGSATSTVRPATTDEPHTPAENAFPGALPEPERSSEPAPVSHADATSEAIIAPTGQTVVQPDSTTMPAIVQPDKTTPRASLPEPETGESAPEEYQSPETKAPPSLPPVVNPEPQTTASKTSTGPAPIDDKPLKPIAAVSAEQTRNQTRDQNETAASPGDSARNAQPAANNWRGRFRKFKRDLSRRYLQVKGWLRIFMRKWQVLFPVFQRFWKRGKKGFSISDPTLLLRYALHEPYLTGMFHANLAILSGMAGRFGVNFQPMPVFAEPCVYARGRATAIIRPWRLVLAMLGLLCEPDLYRELWQLLKWYWASRKRS